MFFFLLFVVFALIFLSSRRLVMCFNSYCVSLGWISHISWATGQPCPSLITQSTAHQRVPSLMTRGWGLTADPQGATHVSVTTEDYIP